MMEFKHFIRKPFAVEAIEITEENIHDIAELVGSVRKDQKNQTLYISLDRRIIPNVTRAYVGWWMTRLGDNYRCYSPGLFTSQFIEHDPSEGYFFESIEDDPDSAPAHGIPRPEVGGGE